LSRDSKLARVLAEFAHTLATDFSIEDTLDHLVLRIVEALPVTGAGIMLMGSEFEPHFVAASNECVEEVEGLQNELNEGPCLTAYMTGEPVVLPDLAEDHRFPRYSQRARDKGLAAVFAFPLRLDGRRLGALDLYRDSPGALDAGDTAAAEVLAEVAAAYLFNARVRSDARESERVLRHRSLHDPLTGLPNRTMLEERLEHALQRVQGSGHIVAVLFVDLDGFKAVNDRFGHHVGDQLLNLVAARLTCAIRPGDTLARLAGDEFVILCEDLSDPSQAETVAGVVADVLAKPFSVSGHLLEVTASVGVAFSQRETHVPRELLRDADLAMYRAKRAGGSSHRVQHRADQNTFDVDGLLVWDPVSGESGHDLKDALERDELRLAYQPIVDTRDGSLSAVEALLRWRHPHRGWVEPETVVAIAERTGLIVPIGKWALTQACRDLRDWRRQHGAERIPCLSVNVSALQVVARGFTETVMAALTESGTDPTSLHLEVTESVLLTSAKRAREVLSELRDLGIVLSLDDFGTGYSSLGYLQQFPFDIVKIDRAFVSDMSRDPSSRAIVAAVIDLAHALDLTVVAEGVETAEQLADLSTLGSDRAQGHYFSEPLLREEFERQLLDLAGPEPIRLPLQPTKRRVWPAR
jgi:diguanylate cyclase (GGDEF)-like protein